MIKAAQNNNVETTATGIIVQAISFEDMSVEFPVIFTLVLTNGGEVLDSSSGIKRKKLIKVSHKITENYNPFFFLNQ